MRRRSKVSGASTKTRRPEAAKPNRRNASKAARGSHSSPKSEETEVTRLNRELNEAREQQTAASEILQVISTSQGDLQPVFEAMLGNAIRICEAKFGVLSLYEDGGFRHVALHGVPAAYAERRSQDPIVMPNPAHVLGRLAATKQVLHVADSMTEPDAAHGDLTRLAGARTMLVVPMLKQQVLIGAIGIYRQEVHPFTDKQIELVKNFAAQAVIAIENARLLNELRQRTADLTERTADLTEALEQQTATSEVLQVISGSPGDLQPVFAAMLENAVRICNATFGNIFRWDGDAFHLMAVHKTPPAFAKARKLSPIRPNPTTLFGRLVATKSLVHTANLAAEKQYVEERRPAYVEAVELGGIRAFLAVPMLKDDELIGAIGLFRQEVRPFTDKQVALVQNFAAQAVIAIENARLLKQLRERTEQVEAQSQELLKLNEQLEQRVADQVGEIERMGRLRRFLPPQVADLIVASGSEKQLESHRREITALFCDLRGFTGFS
jgi:GAF domain-containing protein